MSTTTYRLRDTSCLHLRALPASAEENGKFRTTTARASFQSGMHPIPSDSLGPNPRVYLLVSRYSNSPCYESQIVQMMMEYRHAPELVYPQSLYGAS